MSVLADSVVDWGALAQVAYVSAIAGVAIATLLGLAVVAELRAQDVRESGGGATVFGLRVVTVVSVALVVAAIAVGIYYITDKG